MGKAERRSTIRPGRTAAQTFEPDSATLTRKHIFLLFAGFVVLLGSATFAFLHFTGASEGLIRKALGRVLRADYRIGETRLDLGGRTIKISDLRVADPKKPSLPPLLAIGQVEVGFSANPLGEGVAVREITLRRLHLNLSLVAGEEPDLSQILREIAAEDSTGDYPPAVHVLESKVELHLAPNSTPVLFRDVQFDLRPVRGEPGRLELTGQMTSPLGRTVTIKGSGDVRKREFRTILEATDVPLSADRAAMFSRDVADYLQQAAVAGVIRKATAWLEYRSAENTPANSQITGGISLLFDSLSAAPPTFPYPLQGASGRVFASTSDGGSIAFQIDKRGLDGDLEVSGRLTHLFPDADGEFRPGFDIRSEASDVLIGPSLRNAVRTSQIEVAHRIWNAFEPDGGRIGVNLHLRGDRGKSTPTVAADIELIDVNGKFLGFEPGDSRLRRIAFPYPVRAVSGRVRIRDDTIHLENLNGLGDADGRMTLHGHVVLDEASGFPKSLRVTGERIEFNSNLRGALDALIDGGAAIYDEYGPSGTTNLDVRVRQQRDELAYSVTLEPLQASLTFRGFPYPLTGLAGKVRITEEGVELDLGGRAGSKGRVAGKGRFLFEPTSLQVPAPPLTGLRSELWIEATDLQLDQGMRNALAALGTTTVTAWDFVQPSGRVGGEVVLFKEWGEPEFSYDARLDLVDGTTRVESMPLPLQQIHGRLFLHGTGGNCRAYLSALEGRIPAKGHEPAKVLVQGRVNTQGGAFSIDVTSVIRRLAISNSLRLALHDAGILDATTSEQLAIAGHVDIVGHQRKELGDTELRQRYRIRLQQLSSNAAALPDPVRNVSGELLFEDGKVTGRDLRGLLGETPIVCHEATLDRDADAARLRLMISADSVPIDQRFGRLLGGDGPAWLADWQPGGAIKLTRLDLCLHLPRPGVGPRVTLSGQIEALNLRLGRNLPLTNVNGTLDILEGSLDGNGATLRGRLAGATAAIKGHQLHGLQAEFTSNPARTLVSELSLRLHGGTVQGRSGKALVISHAAGHVDLQADLAFHGVSLAQVLRSSGIDTRLQGSASGELKIDQLRTDRLLDLEARCVGQIENGHLGQVPLFAPFFAYLHPDKQPRFHTGRIEAGLKDQVCTIQHLALASELLQVEGKGKIGLDGYVDVILRIPELLGPAADILVLPIVLDPMISRLLKFQLFGYVRNLKSRVLLPLSQPSGREALTPIPGRPPALDAPSTVRSPQQLPQEQR